MRKGLGLLIVVGFVLFLASVASAISLSLEGVNFSSATAEVEFLYEYNPGTGYGEVDLSIKNTGLYDPILTGFVFNTPAEITSLIDFNGPVGWNSIFDIDNITTPQPFGYFDAAGVTGNNVQGGDPQDGIPQGETFYFDIIFGGNDLDLLSADSFLSELSYVPVQGPGSNGTSVSFLLRGQQLGINGEDSDVLIPKNGFTPVPEPTSIVLFGIGLLGFTGFARRKQKKY